MARPGDALQKLPGLLAEQPLRTPAFASAQLHCSCRSLPPRQISRPELALQDRAPPNDDHRARRSRIRTGEMLNRRGYGRCRAVHVILHAFDARRLRGLRFLTHDVFLSGVSPCRSTERETEHHTRRSEQRPAQAREPGCCCHMTNSALSVICLQDNSPAQSDLYPAK